MSESQVVLIVDAKTDDASTEYTMPTAYMHPEAFLQVQISGTFTVQVLGKLHADAGYIELIAAATASYIQPIAYMPYLKITRSGGADTPICSVWVMVGETEYTKYAEVPEVQKFAVAKPGPNS